MEVDCAQGVLHSTTTLPHNLSSTAKARMCPWGKRTANYLSSSHCCPPRRRYCPLLYNLSTCAWQAQMSPMGSAGRGNYSSQSPSLAKISSQSPSLAKRATTGLQLRQQQQDPIAPCHKNIWPNPMQGLPGIYHIPCSLFNARTIYRIPYTICHIPYI